MSWASDWECFLLLLLLMRLCVSRDTTKKDWISGALFQILIEPREEKFEIRGPRVKISRLCCENSNHVIKIYARMHRHQLEIPMSALFLPAAQPAGFWFSDTIIGHLCRAFFRLRRSLVPSRARVVSPGKIKSCDNSKAPLHQKKTSRRTLSFRNVVSTNWCVGWCCNRKPGQELNDCNKRSNNTWLV